MNSPLNHFIGLHHVISSSKLSQSWMTSTQTKLMDSRNFLQEMPKKYWLKSSQTRLRVKKKQMESKPKKKKLTHLLHLRKKMNLLRLFQETFWSWINYTTLSDRLKLTVTLCHKVLTNWQHRTKYTGMRHLKVLNQSKLLTFNFTHTLEIASKKISKKVWNLMMQFLKRIS